MAVPNWLPAVLRYVAVGLTAPPAVAKFLRYTGSVTQFTALGIPSPEVAVLVVGVVEVVAVVLLLLNRYRSLAAMSLLPVMAVAFLTAGEWQALAVSLAVLGLLAVDVEVIDVADPAEQ
ncbi:MAG: DoxX family membrane protein [Halolamina sp.]